MSFLQKILSPILYLFYTLIAVVVLLEIVLRFYNPIPLRLKGESIVLPINQKIRLKNEFSCFDSLIIHNKNSMGFRGDELSTVTQNQQKIIAVGGSTTECYFVSDDKVWTQVLQNKLNEGEPKFWVNNAGLNGHSTFGHKILLQDHVLKIRPDYVFFLIGVNDIERNDLGDFDKTMLQGQYIQTSKNPFTNLLKTLANNSEVFNLVFNILKALEAKNKQIFIDKVWELNPSDTLSLSSAYIKAEIDKQTIYLPDYKKRMEALYALCIKNKIKPVFITQPLLVGDGIDPSTSTDLAKYKVAENKNGQLAWQKLETYNNILRGFCQENNALCIDLAHLLPKDSRYFSDEMHFTNEGSIKVGEILAKAFKENNTQLVGQ